MIIKMQESGFCAGVRNAVEETKKQCSDILSGKSVYLYGNLVNNAYVMQSFLDAGFCVTDEISEIPDGSVVVIRAHGVARYVYNELKIKNAIIKDCTCVRVKKIHDIVDKKSYDGYKIIVIGKAKHPEIIGTAGWCCTNSVYIIEKKSDLEDIDLSGKICVVAQTTCSKELWNKLTKLILFKNNGAEIYDTTCKVTGNREKKAKSIAKTADAMLVIGDENSSNSKELYKVCCESCKNTFFISSLSDLTDNERISKTISNSTNIGLAASASTSDDTISSVYNYLIFVDFLKTAKKEIEDASCEYFYDFCKETSNNRSIQDSLRSLIDQNEGGKRIRGAMIELGEKIASQGNNNNYLPLAVGYELFQTALLIHDDIIDKNEIRRSKPTINSKFAKNAENGSRISNAEAEHFGNSKALSIGDYGFFISYQFLSKCNVESSILIKIYKLISQVFTITCEGQIIDVAFPFGKISILDNYEEYERVVIQIYEYKTAWYTLAGPIMVGAICGGADEKLITLLKNIAIPLGIAFQIKDDLLGIYSNKNVLGKSVLSDIQENKQTLLFGYAYKNANEEERALLERHYGKNDANEYDLEVVKEIFEKTGAKKYAKDEIIRLSAQSKLLIDSELIGKEYQSVLDGLISYLLYRKF